MNKTAKQIKNDIVIQELIPCLKGTEAYLVGGYIRDLFLGKISYDRDIVLVTTDIESQVRQIAGKLNGTFIELDKIWGIYRIVLSDKENYIDFAKAVENDINKDLLRRDITINAIAYDLNNEIFIDTLNGISDIKNKIIRGISEKNFTDDALRILRLFRFQSTLGFKIDEETYSLAKKHSDLILQPAKERINTELIKLFEGDNASSALINMDKAGLLEKIFPFVSELKQIPPNSHHHLDLFNHSIETVKQIEKNFLKLPEEAKDILSQQTYGTVKKLAYLKLAAFMHDIGKPSTRTIDEATGRERFILHDSKGAELAPKYLQTLKFSKKQIAYIQKMIKNHIYPSNVNINNEKSIMKFLRKMEEDTADIILLAMADRLSARGKDITDEIVTNNINNLNFLLKKYFDNIEAIKPLPKLLSGNEIMELLSISPSEKLGKIINLLKEAQEDGEVTTKEEAVNFVKGLNL